jgi:multidrug efflux system membrane fusion protein
MPQGSNPPGPRRGPNPIWIILALGVIGALGWFASKKQAAKEGGPAGRPTAGSFPVPIIPGTVEQKNVPIYLDGLGTVQAFNTVTVHTRVDGQVLKVAFIEGQDVRAGDVLAQIDPAPFQAQLDQNVAKKAQDEAQVAIARLTLNRDQELLTSKILAQQDYDVQKAMVDQLEATVRGDQAAIDNARIQLAYATITSPLDGRTGLRMLDQGNIVHATDANGLVVITQLRPISVTFTLPEQNLGQIQQHLRTGETLTTLALDRDNRATLSEGKLAVIDNQIDTTTGTIRLKATFTNEDLKLWPGQFVNVRLLLETRQGAVVPASVVQRGPDGDFAFIISEDLTAQVRKIKVSQIDRGQALIEEGLTPGERVVVDGQYKLQAGSKVKLPEPGNIGERSNSPAKPNRT